MSHQPWSFFGDSDDDMESESFVPYEANPTTINNKLPPDALEVVVDHTKYNPSFTYQECQQMSQFAAETEKIKKYNENPLIHSDIKEIAPGMYSHVDGFKSAPLYQSPSVTVDVAMSNRGGSRGLIATEDIEPGTLLLAERCYWPFKSKEECAANQSRPELEFIQELLFELPISKILPALEALSELHPRHVHDIELSHHTFLNSIYGDALQSLIDALPEERIEIISIMQKFAGSTDISSVDICLLLITKIHVNAFPTGISLHMAMVNHSCRPNAAKLSLKPSTNYAKNTKNSNMMKEHASFVTEFGPCKISEIRATNSIKAGEEIFICYIPEEATLLSYQFRQTYLLRQFHFKCTCSLCTEQEHDSEQNTQKDIFIESDIILLEDLTSFFYRIPLQKDLEKSDILGVNMNSDGTEANLSMEEPDALEAEFSRDPIELALHILRTRLEVPTGVSDAVYVLSKVSEIYSHYYDLFHNINHTHNDTNTSAIILYTESIASLLYASCKSLLDQNVIESLTSESLLYFTDPKNPIRQVWSQQYNTLPIMNDRTCTNGYTGVATLNTIRSLQDLCSIIMLISSLILADLHTDVYGTSPSPKYSTLLTNLSYSLKKLMGMVRRVVVVAHGYLILRNVVFLRFPCCFHLFIYLIPTYSLLISILYLFSSLTGYCWPKVTIK